PPVSARAPSVVGAPRMPAVLEVRAEVAGQGGGRGGEEDEGVEDLQDGDQARGLALRGDVAVADGGEGDEGEVEAVEAGRQAVDLSGVLGQALVGGGEDQDGQA